MHQKILAGTLGTLILKILADHGQMYGYQIITHIKEQTIGEILVTEGAVYPTMHRLESAGYLETERRMISGRTRKYYRLTDRGKKASDTESKSLLRMLASLQGLLNTKLPDA
jgi:PadR family transcriptional regulator PadR